MTQSLNFLSFSGRVGRGAYAVIGFLAFAVKHNLDRLLAQSQKLLWSPWNYWIPFGEMFRGAPSGEKEQELAKTLFLVALPFLWIAINVTVSWPFRLGFAYPIEAQLAGEGLTADRQCRFSTGSFKEPILVREPGKHFAFGCPKSRC